MARCAKDCEQWRVTSSAKERIGLEAPDRSLMIKRKRMVASTEPWGTPSFQESGRNRTPSARTKIICLMRKLDVHDTRDVENPNVGSFEKRPSCQTRSKTLEMSREFGCVSPWSSSEANQECEMRAGRSPVGRRDRKPYWRSLSGPSRSRNGRSWSKVTLSNTFEITGVK